MKYTKKTFVQILFYSIHKVQESLCPIKIEGLQGEDLKTEEDMMFCLGWLGAIMQTMEKEKKWRAEGLLYLHLRKVYADAGKKLIKHSPMSMMLGPSLLGMISGFFLLHEATNNSLKEALSLKKSKVPTALSKLTKKAQAIYRETMCAKTAPKK